MSEKLETRVTIGSEDFPVRFSYAYFFEARESDDEDEDTGEKKKFFSTMVLIPKEDKAIIAKINKVVQSIVDEKFKGKTANLKLPLRDGDEEFEEKGDYLKGHYFFNCKSKRRPDVVGTEKVTAEDVAQWDEDNELESDQFKAKNRPKVGELVRLTKDDFKSGDYGRVAVRFYYFENETKGVAVSLEKNVQKLKDGEALGGVSVSAEADFDDDMEEGFAD